MKRVTERDVERFGDLGGYDAWTWAMRAWGCRQTDITSCRLAARYLNKAFESVREYRGPIRECLGGSRFYRLAEYSEHINPRRDRASEVAWMIVLEYEMDWNQQSGGMISAYLNPRGSECGRAKYRERNRLNRMPADARKHWQRQERLLRSIADEDGVSSLRHPSTSTLQQQDDRELRREGSRVY